MRKSKKIKELEKEVAELRSNFSQIERLIQDIIRNDMKIPDIQSGKWYVDSQK